MSSIVSTYPLTYAVLSGFGGIANIRTGLIVGVKSIKVSVLIMAMSFFSMAAYGTGKFMD
jgi:hypothetical protein